MRRLGPLVILVAALVTVACDGERAFEPAEFIEEANAEGAGLVLGEPLASIEEGVDVYSISFEGGSDGAQPQGPGGHTHGGGSLIVTEDAEAARAEHTRCEAAVTLVCYRAANVVLLFDADPSDEDVARVDAAVRALGDQ
jgi:hypothetical protein